MKHGLCNGVPEQNVSSDITPPTPMTPTHHSITEGRKKINYACTECRKAHKACSGGRPCERCIRTGISDKCQSSPRKKRVVSRKSWTSFLQNSPHTNHNNITSRVESCYAGRHSGPKHPPTYAQFISPVSLDKYKLSGSSPSPPPPHSTIFPSLILPPIREENLSHIEYERSRSSSTYLGCIPSPREHRLNSLDGVQDITQKLQVMNCPSELFPAFSGFPTDFGHLNHHRIN
jgi:hypothetical protein